MEKESVILQPKWVWRRSKIEPCAFVNRGNGTWKEYQKGKLFSSFIQTKTDDIGVTLSDDSRDMDVFITCDCMYWKLKNEENWGPMYYLGKWEWKAWKSTQNMVFLHIIDKLWELYENGQTSESEHYLLEIKTKDNSIFLQSKKTRVIYELQDEGVYYEDKYNHKLFCKGSWVSYS